MQEFTVSGDSTPKFFPAVTFSKARAFTLMYSNNRGEFVEGSEERSGRAASHRSCAEGPRPLCRSLRTQFRACVCVRRAEGTRSRRNGRSDVRDLSTGAGEFEAIRVAWDSVCGVAVPDRGESDLRPLPAIG